MEWVQPIQTVLDDIEALNQDMNRLKSDVDGDGVFPIILTATQKLLKAVQ